MAPVIQPKGSFQILNKEKQQSFLLKKCSHAINHPHPLFRFFLGWIYCNTTNQIMDLAQNNKTFNHFYECASLGFYCITDSQRITQYNNSMNENKSPISSQVNLIIFVLTFRIERCHCDWVCTITAETVAHVLIY